MSIFFARRLTRPFLTIFLAILLAIMGCVDKQPVRYMWAVKGHYYGPTFYNYPYTFGLLFGFGLYARYKAATGAFRADYDSFLSSTGMADAVTLANCIGIDIQSVDFWRSSLDVIRGQIADFERLAG